MHWWDDQNHFGIEDPEFRSVQILHHCWKMLPSASYGCQENLGSDHNEGLVRILFSGVDGMIECQCLLCCISNLGCMRAQFPGVVAPKPQLSKPTVIGDGDVQKLKCELKT